METNEVKEMAKILVVDDQAGMRLTLKGILGKKGYRVSLAESGEAALEAVKAEDFRVIFMDIKMPGLSGVDALVKIKAMKPKTAVIMMTAYALEDDIRRAIREGAYTVLNKPFDMERILDIITDCLENRTLVMVVDDRIQDRNLLKTVLEQRGYRVVDVETGEECIKQLRERKFQIVLLDVKLPGIDGIQTLRELKSIRPDVSVVMITGYTLEQQVQQAIMEGSYACLNKPYNVEKLLDVVDQCLSAEKREGKTS